MLEYQLRFYFPSLPNLILEIERSIKKSPLGTILSSENLIKNKYYSNNRDNEENFE